jgi:hypothetical protein
MARFLCVYDCPKSEEPSAFDDLVAEAINLGVEGWLLRATWPSPDLGLQLSRFAWWLHDRSQEELKTAAEFALWVCLEQALSPRQEQRLVDQLVPWVSHQAALQWGGKPILILETPDKLSHPVYGPRRLRRAGGRGRALLLELEQTSSGRVDGQFDGQVENPLQTLPCRRLGKDWDYESFLFHAHHRKPALNLLRTVVPMPDGLAKIHGERHCYRNATATNYREWLRQVAASSDLLNNRRERGLVISTSWHGHREWARMSEPVVMKTSASKASGPGAYTKESPSSNWEQRGQLDPHRLAMAVHGYYLDQFEQLLVQLTHSSENQDIDLFVSTPLHQLDSAKSLLKKTPWSFRLIGVENCGRDLQPFLNCLLPKIFEDGHPFLVKLHTKRSPHLKRGSDWAEHLLGSLTGPNRLNLIRQRMESDPSLGMLVPAGACLPCSVCLAENVRHVMTWLPCYGINEEEFLSSRFAAGSMAAIRTKALAQFVEMAPSRHCYEEEADQTDGTLAHAMERLMGALVQHQGFRIEELPGKASLAGQFGHGWAGVE